jgi:hypothetical protein
MFTPSLLPEMVIGTEAARALMLHDQERRHRVG